jgi:hypothetical protein
MGFVPAESLLPLGYGSDDQFTMGKANQSLLNPTKQSIFNISSFRALFQSNLLLMHLIQ